MNIKKIQWWSGAGGGVSNNASIIFDAHDFYLESAGFDYSSISGSQKHTIHFIVLNTQYQTANRTLGGIWQTANGQRAFFVRINSSKQVEYLHSFDGGATFTRVVSTSLVSNWNFSFISIVIDPSLSGAANVFKIYINGTLSGSTVPTDAGAGKYTMFTGATKKLTLGCHFDSSNVRTDKFKGCINYFAIHNEAMTASQISNLYSSGFSKISYSEYQNSCVIATDIDNSTWDGSKYTIPEQVSGNNFIQTLFSSSDLGPVTSFVNPLSPNASEFSMTEDDLSTENNFFTNRNMPGVTMTFDYPGLNFNLAHTNTSLNPLPDLCLSVSKGCWDLQQSDLWLRCYYDFDTYGTLPMSHGGFAVINPVDWLIQAVITHRSLIQTNGNYRCVVEYSDGTSQVSIESNVFKGKYVYTKFTRSAGVTTVSFWYNNSGTLTQMGTDSTFHGRYVRMRCHAKDDTQYAVPDNYNISELKVYRATPTDL